MDELIIGEKTYISSKRAAKITGYAKDYIGQLCREGRVEARLVGRNWYVLESSITEHRFGISQKEEIKAVENPEISKIRPISWSEPTYVQEEMVQIPPLIQKDPDIASSRRVVSEMQNAWQEWFSNQAPSTSNLAIENGAEVFDGSLVPEIVEEQETEEEVHISRIENLAEEIETPHVQETEEEVVHFHSITPREQYTAAATEVMDLSSRLAAAAESVIAAPVHREKRGASLVVKTVLLGAAFVAACIAFVGTGMVEEFTGVPPTKDSLQGQVLQYLGGESEYINSK